MWFIILLALAAIAYLLVKGVKAQSEKKQAEADRLTESTGLEGSLNHDNAATTGSPDGNTLASSSSAVAAAASVVASVGLDSGNSLSDAQEMIKILNLAESDAGRLSITKEQFAAIRQGAQDELPASDALDAVALKLRKMLS